MLSKQRIKWIDTARALAIFSVIVCHATETFYAFNLNSVLSLNLLNQLFSFSSFTFGRLGVPFFLFMTGFLLLDRQYDNEACIKFWRTKWTGLLIATELWIVIYDVFLALYGAQTFSFGNLLRDMLFFQYVNMGHFWYMPMILGIYLFLPIISNALRTLNTRTLIFPVLLIFALTSFAPVLSLLWQGLGGDGFASLLDLGFSGGLYGTYLLLGLFVKRRAFKKIPSYLLATVGIISFVIVVVMQLWLYHKGLAYNVWYSNGFLLLSGLCFFELLSRTTNLPSGIFVKSLAKYSFAIYLTHFPIKMLLTPWIGIFLNGSAAPSVILLIIATLLISWGASILLSKIPFVGEKLLYMR